jgi:hypothetical protein
VKRKLTVIVAATILTGALCASAQGRWGTGRGAQNIYSDEQVCRNGVTWRYADIDPQHPVTYGPSGGGIPLPMTLYRVISSPTTGGPVEENPVPALTGPENLPVPVNPTWVDPAEVGSGGLTGYEGLYAHSAIFTSEFRQVQPVGADVRVQWSYSPSIPFELGFVFPRWTVADCHLIDIAPREFPNRVRPEIRRDQVAVAVITTPTLDAGSIKARGVRFGTDGFRAKPRAWRLRDADGDADRDLVLRFNTRLAGISCTSRTAKLEARLQDGTRISGSDTVEPVGC